MKTVPVTLGFSSVVIGHITLEERHIPAGGNYCFAIAGRVSLADNNYVPGQLPNKPIVGAFDLTEVSLVTDERYAEYLKQTGVV